MKRVEEKQQTAKKKTTNAYHDGEVQVPECHQPQLLEIDTDRSVLNKNQPTPQRRKQRNKRKPTHPTP